MSKHVRVFSIESPSALDAFQERSESATLRALCKVLGHPFATSIVSSKADFEAALKYLTSINPEHIPSPQRAWPLCLHIAAHGDESGLAIGAEDASWKYLARQIGSFIKGNTYSGPVLVIISACGAGEQRVTKELESLASVNEFKPPAYLFVTHGDVGWGDAIVAWSIFYHSIGDAELEQKREIMTILDKIRLAGAGTLRYFRWDGERNKYVQYTPGCDVHKRVS